MSTLARMLFVGLLAALGISLGGGAGPTGTPAAVRLAPQPKPEPVVYLAGGLSDEALFALASASSRPDVTLLLDSRSLTPYLKHFLGQYKSERIVAIGRFEEDAEGLSRRLGVAVEEVVPWDDEVWARLFPGAERAVVCQTKSRALLLDAACLAGAERVPLHVVPPGEELPEGLKKSLSEGKIKHLHLVGDACKLKPDVPVTRLTNAVEVRAAYLKRLGLAVDCAVVINSADLEKGMGGMSALAPWLAVRKRAALLMTGAKGTDVPEVVKEAARRAPLAGLDTVILLGNLRAIPTHQRPNPIPDDKDKVIDMEPLTPPAGEPVSFAVGRLFHDDRAVVPLMLARQAFTQSKSGPRTALIASNPGSSLPLLETFSRSTARELRNAGWDVTALYGDQVTPKKLRQRMLGPDLFLWEGHHNTLVKEWGFTKWDEAMPPSFVFLQSCLALMPEKVEPLLARGAVGVVGTSTRTYSGSGGAFSLCFLNGCVHEERTTGDSLRQSKNFLVCYAKLKQKRLGSQAKRTGANHRAAWAFTLWGDPTFRLPAPTRPNGALPFVRHQVVNDTLVVTMPDDWHDRLNHSKYQVRMPANGRLAGLLRYDGDEESPRLVPFVFAEVALPKAPPGFTPKLRSRLPSSQWVFVWDERRKVGYLLALAPTDRSELRFRIEWPPGASIVSERMKDEG
jgi:hypothetical protein